MDAADASSAKRALAKAQRLLQLKRTAFTLRDFREALEECLKPEASAATRALGFRIAARAPTCATLDTWQLLVDAAVTELAGSQNAPALLAALPLLSRAPLVLVLRFLATPEREPMNKLRAVLTHEQSDVRCTAVAATARLTLDVAASLLTADALLALPFEAHEARVCCQQDVWTIIVDAWKLIFQALFLVGSNSGSGAASGSSAAGSPESAGVAFAAMRMLFARGAAVNALGFAKESPLTQSAVNDLVSAVFREAFPRILAIQAAARKLPMKLQVDALAWIAMLLYMMMDKSGARCPGVSLPYLEIDPETASNGDDDDDDENQLSGSTRRVRTDQLASDLLESWICPLFARKASLPQRTALCRATFVLLSHPLQEFTRLKRAPVLVSELVAQCFFHKSSELKLEMRQMLVKAFAWVPASSCTHSFVRVVEALSLMERKTDRQGLIQQLMDSVCKRVVRKQEFLVLESLCALEFFRQPQGSSKLSPRANGSQVFRCLAQSLALQNAASPLAAQRVQVAQLIVLKAFQSLLVSKPTATTTENAQSSQLCYAALLTCHYQSALRSNALLFRESLAFFQQDVQRAWGQILSAEIRVQLIWIGVQLAVNCQGVPVERLYEQLVSEVQTSFSTAESESELGGEAQVDGASTVFGDGRLGSSAGGAGSVEHGEQTKWRANVELLVAVSDCAKALVQLQPQLEAHVQQLCGRLKQWVAATTSATSLESSALQEALSTPLSLASGARSTTKSLYSQAVFHPAHLFVPQKYQEPRETSVAGTESHQPFGETSGVVVTGSSDPFSIRVSYKQPVPGHEDVLALCVSCCNVTNVALGDFEIQIRPLGALKCVDALNDLKLRMLQGGGSASGNLPVFGVFRSEKRFQLHKFAQAAFFFQIAFTEVDVAGDGGGGGDDQPEAALLRLAPSEKFIVNFDALFRAPKSQFASGAYFQRVWQGAEATCQFPVESTAANVLSDTKRAIGDLSFCQRVVKHCNARVSLIRDLLVDTPIHIHVAFLAETRWDEFVAASVTLSRSSSSTAAECWSGVVEFRASSASVRELVKAPQDALCAFCASPDLQIASSNPHASGQVARADPALASALTTPSGDTDSTFGRASSNKWPASPFSHSMEFGGEQLRPATAPAGGADLDPWM